LDIIDKLDVTGVYGQGRELARYWLFWAPFPNKVL
jgi:hypothetical protein